MSQETKSIIAALGGIALFAAAVWVRGWALRLYKSSQQRSVAVVPAAPAPERKPEVSPYPAWTGKPDACPACTEGAAFGPPAYTPGGYDYHTRSVFYYSEYIGVVWEHITFTCLTCGYKVQMQPAYAKDVSIPTGA